MYHNSNLVYFSEGTRIWEKGAGNLTDHSNLRLVHSGRAKITALTVDWLYRKLYYVSDGKVCPSSTGFPGFLHVYTV